MEEEEENLPSWTEAQRVTRRRRLLWVGMADAVWMSLCGEKLLSAHLLLLLLLICLFHCSCLNFIPLLLCDVTTQAPRPLLLWRPHSTPGRSILQHIPGMSAALKPLSGTDKYQLSSDVYDCRWIEELSWQGNNGEISMRLLYSDDMIWKPRGGIVANGSTWRKRLEERSRMFCNRKTSN